MGTKKITLCCNIFFLITFATAINSTPDHLQSIKNIKNKHEKIVFLWDLHNVVFQRNLSDWFYILWNYNRKLDILKKIDSNMLKIAGHFLLNKLHLTNQEITSEEVVAYAKKKNNTALIDIIEQIGCSYHPIQGTIKIIEELNRLKYRQDVGSNIGASLLIPFEKKFHHIFKNFKVKYVIHHDVEKKIIKKPNPEYYIEYLKKHNLKPEHVIFIDDKKINVTEANKLGITGIVFTEPKKLRHTLKQIGIFK